MRLARWACWLWPCVAQVALAQTKAPAAAATAGRPSPYRVAWAGDTAFAAGALLLTSLLDGVVVPTLAAPPTCRLAGDARSCDPARLLAVDRFSVGRLGVGHGNAGWRITSDALQSATLAFTVLASGVVAAMDARGVGPARAAAIDLLVLTQAVAVATLASSTLKLAVHRPRPCRYRSDGAGRAAQTGSFPSGHTTAVAAAATAWASSVALRRPLGFARLWAWGAASTVIAAVATGRVLAGEHFFSDVLAGAALGCAFGMAVPAWHRRPNTAPTSPQPGLAVVPLTATQLALQLRW